MEKFKVEDKVKVVLTKPLSATGNAPKLVMHTEHEVQKIITDSKGNQHLDIGLKSDLNWITSLETGEELQDGDKIHWCHPSRFEKI